MCCKSRATAVGGLLRVDIYRCARLELIDQHGNTVYENTIGETVTEMYFDFFGLFCTHDG